jgi:hypothetical protein
MYNSLDFSFHALTEIATPLDPSTTIAIWEESHPKYLKPGTIEKMMNPQFKGWYCSGQTVLQVAIASVAWRNKHLGQTFSGSIHVVAPAWIFPLPYEVPQNWQSLYDSTNKVV